MSHNIVQVALDQATNMARLKIAKRCQTDLFYLCKYILGYDLMSDTTHKDICSYTLSMLPLPLGHPPKSVPSEGPGKMISSTLHASTEKNITAEKGVSGPQNEAPSPENITKNNTEMDQSSSSNMVPGENTENPLPDQNDEKSHREIGDSESYSSNEPVGHAEDPVGHAEDKDTYDPNKNFLLCMMPRGTFKSSLVTIGFSLQYLLNDCDARILIDSETFAKCNAFLAEIKGHLEGNDKFREVFYTIYGCYPDDKAKSDLWSNSELNIASRKRRRKEPSLSCGGIGTTKNGMHYDLVIADDLMSENNITTKDQIDKVIMHYRLILSLLDPGKPLIMIGTRWDYNDVYQYILDYERDRFNILIRKAYNPDGSLFFPERLTQKFLDQTKKSQGSYIFSCQYMNEPVDNESATFKRSYFKHSDMADIKDRPINWYLSVDPSYEGPYSDYAAFVLGGMDYMRELYVKDIVRDKMTYSDIIEHLFHLNEKYKPKQILLETIAHQKSLTYMLNSEQSRRGVWLPIVEIKSRSASKEERIRGLAPYYEFGRVHHIRQSQHIEDLEYELLHFPRGTHDDIIDAFATILEFATPPTNRAMESEKRKQARILYKPRSPLIGI